MPIGQLIKEELKTQKRGATWFASQLNCDRSTVYDIFLRTNIDIELLKRISIILNRNFFEDISKDFSENVLPKNVGKNPTKS